MIEFEYLLNFGAIGAFCAYLIWQVKQQQIREDKQAERIETVINNNTIALTKCYEELRHEESVEQRVQTEITDLRELRKLQELKKLEDKK